MSSIDTRTVQMQFDNSQFERGVKTTMSSLTGLDNQIISMGKGGALSGIAAGVESLADRFSSLGIVGMSIIENLTDRIVNMGIQMVKSVTVDQVAEGMRKYESITTNTMALVNQADISYDKAAEYIEKLAWYSDATSFSLSNMVSGLQAFARQGIDLDKAIPTIMGIGNSVTYAGQSAKEGSRAFDIYAAALAKGGISLMEWRRLGYLNVSTAKLKEQFLEAAVAVGTLGKESEKTYRVLQGDAKGTEVTFENFERTLTGQKGGWATVDVINKVFGEYYGSYTSKLADATLEYQKQNGVVLTLDEAMEKLGDQSNKLGKIYLQSATKARTFTEAVDAAKDATSTAFYQIAQSIFGTPEEAVELWTELNDFLVTNFSQPIVDLANIFGGWHDEGGRNDFINGIKELYNAVKTYLEPIFTLISDFLPKISSESLTELTDRFEKFARSLLQFPSSDEVSESIGNTADRAAQKYEALYKAGQDGIVESDKFISQAMHNQQKAYGLYEEFIEELDKVDERTAVLERNAKIKNFFDGIADALTILKNALSDTFQLISKYLGPTIEAVSEDLLTIAGALGEYLTKIKENGKLTEWFSSVLKILEPVLSLVTKAIQGLTGFLADLVTSGAIDKIAQGLSDLVVGLNPIKSIFEFISGIFANIIEGVKTLANTIKEHLVPALGDGRNTTGLSAGLLILMAIRKILEGKGSIDFWTTLTKGIGTAIEMLENLSDALEGFISKIRIDAFAKVATSLGIMAAALLILGSMDLPSLAKGFLAIAGAAAVLCIAFDSIGKLKVLESGSIMKMGAPLVTLSAAVLLLAVALRTVGKLDVEQIIVGLGVIVGLIAALEEVLIRTSGFEKGNKMKGLMGLSIAILILTASIAILGNIQWEKVVQGLAAVALILGGLVAFTNAISSIDTKGILAVGAAFVLIAAAIDTMAIGIAVLGSLNPNSVVQGLLAMGAMLAAVWLLAKGLDKKAGEVLIIGAALIEISAALVIFAAAMALLSSINWKNLAISMGAVAIAIAAFIAAGTFIGGAAAVGMLALSVGIAAMSASLLVLAAALAALSMIGLLNMAEALGGVLLALVAFGGAGAIIGGAAVVGMIAFAAGLAAISAALIVLGIALEKIATASLLFKVASGQMSASVISDFQSTQRQVETSTKAMEKTVDETTDNITQDVKDTAAEVEQTEDQLSVQSMLGANSLNDGLTGLAHKFGIDITSLTNGTGTDLINSFDATGGDLTGIMDGTGDDLVASLISTGGELNTESIGIGGDLSVSWKGIGGMVMEGLKNGLKAKLQSVLDWMSNLGNQMQGTFTNTMGIYSPSRVFAQYGEYIDQGLINGLQNYAGKVEKSTTNLGNQVINAFSKPMDQVAALAESDLSIKPKITPVIDASNIQNGQKLLNSMFSNGNLTTSIGGVVNPNASALGMISSEIAQLKSQMASMNSRQINEQTLATILTAAMRNVDINMDGTKVGKIVTNYQNQSNRASGW